MYLLIPYQYDADLLSRQTGLALDPDEDMTVQSFAEEADINEIVRRFGITGDLPVPRALAEYGDFSEVTDFQTAMEQVRRGQEAFMELPAAVRARFDNDPLEFWEWLQADEQANLEEAMRLGLIAEPPAAASVGDGEVARASESSDSVNEA